MLVGPVAAGPFLNEIFMRKLLTLLLPLALMLPVSCSKDIEPQQTQIGDEEHTVTLQIKAGCAQTKAYNTSDLTLTDGVQRLDLYIFHQYATEEDRHVTITPDPSGTTEFRIKEKKGERVGIIAMANLDADTAELLAGHTLADFADDWNMPCPIVWTANNFDFDRMPMVGARDTYFTGDSTVEIELRRLMWRIDIGSIVYAPEDDRLRGKDVFVKNIAITNIGNHFNPTKSSSIGHFYTWYLFFGNDGTGTSSGGFGGVNDGFRFYTNAPTGWSQTGTWNPGGPGILNQLYPRTINNNWKVDRGVLNIDATGKYRDATCQTYDVANGQGRLATAGNTASQSMTVGKSLYGFMGRGCFSSYSSVSTYNDQVQYPKLVIELVIDGVSKFYPICITYPQPNTVYQVGTITIVGEGSDYSNFIEQKYYATFSISVRDWDQLEVNNIDVGVDPVTGQPIGGQQN